jgi:uncharacterized protein YbjQ (UPF0145 family)
LTLLTGILVIMLGALLAVYLASKVIAAAQVAGIEEGERLLPPILITDLKTPPSGFETESAQLVIGESVVGTDYWTTFTAGVRSLFGGEVYSLSPLLGRARRQANLRMLEDAARLGATAVINVRFETSDLGGAGRAPVTEVYAYGTALVPRRTST